MCETIAKFLSEDYLINCYFIDSVIESIRYVESTKTIGFINTGWVRV